MILLALALAAGVPGDSCIRYVHDGDTVKRCDGRRLRLVAIDAPEVAGSPSCTVVKRSSHWCDYRKGEQAKRALERFLARGEPVVLYTGRIDPYGRPLVRITVNGRDAGQWLIAQGFARRW